MTHTAPTYFDTYLDEVMYEGCFDADTMCNKKVWEIVNKCCNDGESVYYCVAKINHIYLGW